MAILDAESLGRAITFGGECSANVPAFTWTEKKYGNAAVVWIDVRPDITLHGAPYCGFRAMALAACAGKGDPLLLGELPAAS